MLDELPVHRLRVLKPRSRWRFHQVYRSQAQNPYCHKEQ